MSQANAVMGASGTTPRALSRAHRIVLAVPALLLAGAYAFQYLGPFPPCEMCWWQRYGHFTALALAVLALVLRPAQRPLIALAAAAMAISGAIGVFHAGVEYRWWEGLTSCSAVPAAGGDFWESLSAQPLIRCDTAPWTMAGISMAGYNAIISLSAAVAALVTLRRDA